MIIQQLAGSDNPTCEKCGLYVGCSSPFMRASGNVKPGCVLVVGEAPGATEDRRGRAFIGQSGTLLRRMLKAAGINPDDVAYTNAVKCRPKDNKLATKPKKLCQEFLHWEVEQLQPKAILLLGATALSGLLKKGGVKKQRLTHLQYDCNGRVIPCSVAYHPAYILRNQHLKSQFEKDLKFFANVLNPRTTQRAIDAPQIIVEPTEKQLTQFIEQCKKIGFCSVDTETSTLKPFVDVGFDVMCAGLSNGRTTVVLRFDNPLGIEEIDGGPKPSLSSGSAEGLSALKSIMGDLSISKVMHNAKYDLHILWERFGIALAGRVWDTELLHSTLYPIQGGHDLDTVASEVLGIAKYKHMVSEWIRDTGETKGKYTDIPWDVLAQYQGLDAYYTAKLFPTLWGRLKRADATHTDKDFPGMRPTQLMSKLIEPATHTLYEMECKGFSVDIDHLELLSVTLNHKEQNLLSKLFSLPTVVRYVDARKSTYLAEVTQKKRPPRDDVLQKRLNSLDFNPGSPKQLIEILFDGNYYGLPFDKDAVTTTGQPQTGREVLELLMQYLLKDSEQFVFCELVCEHKAVSKLRSTFVDGLRKFISPNVKIHSSYNQGRAVTGRLSSSDPNMQNIPTHENDDGSLPYRNQFCAGKGKTLVVADYGQIELRVLAVLSCDLELLRIFQGGLDLHDETARTIYDIGPNAIVSKEMRRNAKVVNFGVVYGESAFGLAKNLGISNDAAAEFIRAFFHRFAGVWDWQQAIHQFAVKHGKVYTMFGRARDVANIQIDPKSNDDRKAVAHAFRQAINSPVQGTASDMALISLMSLTKHLKLLPFYAAPIAIIHDEIVIETIQGKERLVGALTRQIMMSTPKTWLAPHFDDMLITVDLEVGTSWGSLETLHV